MTVGCDVASLASAGVRGLAPYQPGKPVEELERELGIRNIVKLASNENPLGCGEAARRAAALALADAGRYPDGSGFRLKRVLAASMGVEPSAITLGNGSNDVLELVARAFATPADEVVFSQHAFAVFPLVTQAVGACAVEVPARDFGHDPVAMAAAMGTRTRLVFIANPNNPSGTWLRRRELAGLLEAAPAHAIVVVDEAYCEYVGEAEYPDAVAWLARFPNLVVTRTFSKAFGLAGLRVGYAVSSPALAEVLNRVRQPFNVGACGLAAAEAAFADHAHIERSRALNAAGQQQLRDGLRSLGLGWIDSVGNFLAVDLARPAGAAFDALLREGVIVRPVGNYGLPHHLRVTIGTAAENERLLRALATVLPMLDEAAE